MSALNERLGNVASCWTRCGSVNLLDSSESRAYRAHHKRTELKWPPPTDTTVTDSPCAWESTHRKLNAFKWIVQPKMTNVFHLFIIVWNTYKENWSQMLKLLFLHQKNILSAAAFISDSYFHILILILKIYIYLGHFWKLAIKYWLNKLLLTNYPWTKGCIVVILA